MNSSFFNLLFAWLRWVSKPTLRFAACLLLLAICYSLFAFNNASFAADVVLKAGVSIDKVPKEFYGTWRVSSTLISTNAQGLFKEKNIDLWNLSRAGDVITLDNPFSGAHANIMVSDVNERSIKFKKVGDYDSKKLTDTVQLVLSKDSFKGTNNLKLDTISDVDGTVIKTEWAVYNLTGEKISGETIK